MKLLTLLTFIFALTQSLFAVEYVSETVYAVDYDRTYQETLEDFRNEIDSTIKTKVDQGWILHSQSIATHRYTDSRIPATYLSALLIFVKK